MSSRLTTCAILALVVGVPEASAADPPGPARDPLQPLLAQYCHRCHGATEPKGGVRLDNLTPPDAKNKDALATWLAVYEQMDRAQMPPVESKQPPAGALDAALAALQTDLARAGTSVARSKAREYPAKGNLIDHDALFRAPTRAAPATPARVWRISPFAYRAFADDLTGGRLIVQGGPAVRSKMIPLAPAPFGLTTDHGFRDYAFRYQVSGSESQQLAMNAKVVPAGMLDKRPRYTPPAALTAVAGATGKPSDATARAAVRFLFNEILYREPTADELTEHAAFVQGQIARHGNRDGLILGLVPVFLHPEAVFRSELGEGKPDEHGRRMLGPTELAVAISYALTDHRPDAALFGAARGGKLTTREDVRREVTRLLDSPVEKPRILRFFHEYFDYDRAPEVFKDPADLKLAGIRNKYDADPLVTDTDMLVLHVLKGDRDVLKLLLTTDLSFVDYPANRRKGAQSPFGTRPGQSDLNKHYNFDPAKWSDQMPFRLPDDQRAGVLTQPSWLIAHSANTENHAIHRGKWVRERLLGGFIPDTPITVEAKLPDEPRSTLRHRMRVTREAYCAQCHRLMDPLGLPFETFDHLGQYRTHEQGKPVDASGEVVGTGVAELDGKVKGPLDLVRRLAGSERVEQVFVRHAFRYWMGRNETLDDAPTLRAAHKAYAESGGSMKALIVSLLTSDSFLYRRS